MANGMYSDDTLEDSLFRDDEIRVREELEKELNEHGEVDSSGKLVGMVIMAILIAGFSIWFFMG